ncbi:MAG: dihydroorotase [Rickettsiales bacterium]|nr:dihydroorotase [Pseudomonadota bacterium]MDA0966436.1 dihydroorotase [Pseudomonadota bacterium]MDG4543298.1 dihydroorotase [Rickettsiales bacterium]MDG4545564.1 dihydroorotase [Rickettsiales bacterium]MDG4548013.1 dihydroorotase [Rickettsiales bacterium]
MPQIFYRPQETELKDTAFINARIIDPESGYDEVGTLIVKDGKISRFGSDIVPSDDMEIIDCRWCVLCPGLLDIQVHFRTPGQEYKEDIITGTKSAAAGGVTTCVCMANTSPVIDSVEVVNELYKAIQKDAYVNTYTYASITKGLKGQELTDMQALKEAGVIGFSDDGLPVMNSLVMRRAMEKAEESGMLISQHCEDKNLSDGGCINEGEISEKLGLKGVPNASEAIIVERDLLLLELTKGHYHVLHISTHQAIEAVRRAKAKGFNVTCEAAPHHFVLTDHAVEQWDTLAKMNPPLRAEKDKLAIIEGLKDGTIDVIATDHAPHEPDSKCVHISDAAFGIVGLETMLPLSLELYHQGYMSLPEVLGKMTYKAADVIGKPVGRIKEGLAADLTLIDVYAPWEIQSCEFSSKSKNSPFDGYKVKGRAVRTIVGGKTVFELED